MVVTPVNLSQKVVLPASMSAVRLDKDLADRAKGYWMQAVRLGMSDVAQEFLGHMARGYATPFNRAKFQPKPGDAFYDQKTAALDAFEDLAEQFSGRISNIVWESLAYLATRPDPTKEQSILAEKDHLPLPYYVVDTVLHALGKVYGLKLHIDSTIFQRSGMIFEHNCDCSCYWQPPNEGGISVFLDPSRFQEATAALFSHLVSESLLLMGLKMPFEMGLSPEAAEIMAAAA